MDIDAITVEVITKTLRACQQGQKLPPDLLALDLLSDPPSSSPGGQDIRLRDLILNVTTEELARARQAEGVAEPDTPLTRETLRRAIESDFGGGGELQAWSALYHRYLAPIEFSAEKLAEAAHVDPRHFRRLVDAGTRRLTDHLRRAEMAAHARARALRLGRHLPPPDYAQLFGINLPCAELTGLLRGPDGPAFISIEGLGGIGKTALARVVAFDLARDSEFDGICWISARHTFLSDSGALELLPQAARSVTDVVNRLATQLGFTELAGLDLSDKLERLSTFLATVRYLIVIDNLESLEDVDALLPALASLGEPTRFLLTSRQSLTHYPFVQRLTIPPLTFEDSLSLVESELTRRRREVALSPVNAARLYDVVGGMPLALKLIAAQLARWPLDVILESLRQATLPTPESLYTFIYRQAWAALDNNARELLVSLLTIAPEGDDIEWLRLVSFLPPAAFDQALAQLLAYSLLETVGEPDYPKFRLHRLTVTFLQSEILTAWDE